MLLIDSARTQASSNAVLMFSVKGDGAVTVAGTLAVTGAVTLSSTLAVTDASTLSGAVTMGSTLNVRVNARVIGRVCCVVISCVFVLYVYVC